QGVGTAIWLFDLAYVAIAGINLCLLAFLYTQFEARLTRRFHGIALLQGFIVLLVLFPFHTGFTRLMLMVGFLVYPWEWLRIVFRAIGKKEQGAIAIGIGVMLVSAG